MFKVSDLVFDRYSKLGYEKLNEPEKVFHCVWGLEAEVNNGGFHQYYFNSAGDQALDTVKSLEAIEAKHTALLVRQANALFGEAGPLSDRFARQNQLFALGEAKTTKMNEIEKQFMKYDDKLGQLIRSVCGQKWRGFRAEVRPRATTQQICHGA
ncbi:MAG TPA: DMP19 family protein [Gemmataceae bacterium]|nr:DMP19 family protein [Gemmataceae bacterium]